MNMNSTTEEGELAGKVCLITGAASGIGWQSPAGSLRKKPWWQ